MKLDEWYTPNQLAKVLRVGPNRIRGWIHRGELAASNVSDGEKRPRWRISQESLDDFLEGRTPSFKPKPRRRHVTQSTSKWF